MCLLKLIIRNIIKLYKESISVCLYISAGIIVSVFGILFYSGYIMTVFDSGDNINELSLIIDANKDKEYISDIVAEIMDEPSLNSIYLYSDLNEKVTGLKIAGMYDALSIQHMYYGESYDKSDTSFLALISDATASELGLKGDIADKTINWDDNTYKIIGMHRFAPEICIPPFCFIENYEVKRVKVSFNSQISEDLIKKLENDAIEYKLKNNSDFFTSGEFIFNFVIVIMIFSVSFLNIFAMFSFWRIRMKNTFSTYYICGCKNADIFFIIFGIVAVTILWNSLLGFVIFTGLYGSFVKIEVIAVLPFINYFKVFGCVVLILVVYAAVFGFYSTRTISVKGGNERI